MVHPNNNAPDDVVTGLDPAFSAEDITLPGFKCSCGYVDRAEVKEEHLAIAHPADRSDELTCHVTATWNSSSWCIRPLGHDQGENPTEHWTPTHLGGKYWTGGWKQHELL